MNSKTTISATEARKKFFDIINKVEKTSTPFTITVNGEAKAVLMNAEDFDSWKETLEIMSNPKLVKGIEESKKELREGKYSTFEEVFGMTAEEALSDKGKEKYGTRKK